MTITVLFHAWFTCISKQVLIFSFRTLKLKAGFRNLSVYYDDSILYMQYIMITLLLYCAVRRIVTENVMSRAARPIDRKRSPWTEGIGHTHTADPLTKPAWSQLDLPPGYFYPLEAKPQMPSRSQPCVKSFLAEGVWQQKFFSVTTPRRLIVSAEYNAM